MTNLAQMIFLGRKSRSNVLPAIGFKRHGSEREGTIVAKHSGWSHSPPPNPPQIESACFPAHLLSEQPASLCCLPPGCPLTFVWREHNRASELCHDVARSLSLASVVWLSPPTHAHTHTPTHKSSVRVCAQSKPPNSELASSVTERSTWLLS